MIEIESYGHRFKVVDPATYPYGPYEFTDEIAIKAAYWNDIQPDEVVIDIGASWGGYTLPALALGAERVFAVEPAERAGETLLQSVQANGWEQRVRLVRVALWDDTPIPESFRDAAMRNFGGRETDALATRTLDDLADRLHLIRLDRIHCDAEGAELPIVRGGRETLRRFRPRLLIEDHTKRAGEPDAHLTPYCIDLRDKLLPILHELQYETEIVEQLGGGNPMIVAVPR